MTKRVVAVRIAGREYRILSDADEGHLQRVAAYLDRSMARVRKNTGTVDSLDVAVLTALNITRELVELRGANETEEPDAAVSGFELERLQSLIELVEASTGSSDATPADEARV